MWRGVDALEVWKCERLLIESRVHTHLQKCGGVESVESVESVTWAQKCGEVWSSWKLWKCERPLIKGQFHTHLRECGGVESVESVIWAQKCTKVWRGVDAVGGVVV